MPHSQLDMPNDRIVKTGYRPGAARARLTINLEPERESIIQALNLTHKHRRRCAGCGRRIRLWQKSSGGVNRTHRRNFLVATLSLDLLELPPHRSFDIYREAMRHVRYPDTDERGLELCWENR